MSEDGRWRRRWARTWRIALACVGIVAVVNGSLRMSDDVWPFGPMSQYAFSPTDGDTVVVTRVIGELPGGSRMEIILRAGVSGIGRAEVEAQIPAIEADPSLLRDIAEGYARHHRDAPRFTRLWLVQDITTLAVGAEPTTERKELATWGPS